MKNKLLLFTMLFSALLFGLCACAQTGTGDGTTALGTAETSVGDAESLLSEQTNPDETNQSTPSSTPAPTPTVPGVSTDATVFTPTHEPTPTYEPTPTPDDLLFDDFDLLDRSSASALAGSEPYLGGIREINKKNIVFSVSSDTLQRLLYWSDTEYAARLIFTQKESSLNEEHTFSSVTVPISSSSWGSVDFVLKSDAFDCGFCPTVGRRYAVELAIVTSDQSARVLYEGKYECQATARLKLSPYYEPTDDAGPSVTRTYALQYFAKKNGSIEGNAVQRIYGGAAATAVRAVPDEGYRFTGWSDGVATPERTDAGVSSSAVFTAYFERIDKLHLASVYITTPDGQPIGNKDYSEMKMKIVAPDQPVYDLDSSVQIKIRGNSSVGSVGNNESYESKNSYSIKLPEKQKLLGLGDGKSKKWVLNANKFDLLALRNYLVWDFADYMGTIPFVPECTWVHLYVNGEYRDLYTLCEKVNVEKGRVDVDDSPTGNPDKGYLIELDFRGHAGGDPWFDVKGYGPDPLYDRYSAIEFVIKSDIEGDADLAFIKDYVQRCHDAIMRGNREEIEKLVDLSSLIDLYIIEELSKDCDSGRASFYVCKDKGGKLFFTAPWDFDFGFGTYEQATVIPGRVSQGEECCTWFASLISRKWFLDAVRERLAELQPKIEKVISDVVEKAELIGDDIDRNAERWGMYGSNFHVYVSRLVSSDLKNLDEHVDFIVKWIRDRYDWLLEN